MSQTFHIHVRPELQNAPLLVAFSGWSDAGASATSALDFVSDTLHTAPLADLDPEDYYDFTVCRPMVRRDPTGGNEVRWPTTQMRYASVGADRELVTLAGPEPHFRWRGFCDAVAGLAESLGVHRVVLLGSYLADVVYSQPVEVTGFASDPKLLEVLGVQASSYEGPTGIVGVLAERLGEQGCEFVSLWAGLPHYIDVSPNPRGALALVQLVGRHLALPLDTRPLEREAAEFEERISRLVAGDSELAEYVRNLKRRKFAQ